METIELFNGKNILKLLRKQAFSNRILLGGLFAISFLLMCILVLVSYFTGISVSSFTRDPLALADIPFYSGYFSQLGNIIWFFAAGITFFTYRISHKKFKKFLLFSTVFSVLLGIDDFFLIHDGFFPAIGLNENWMYIIYAVFTAYYFIAFNVTILITPFVFLVLDFGFFAISILNDLIKIPGLNPFILEDGSKMAGILSWGVYFYKSSILIIEKTRLKQEMQFYTKKLESVEISNLKKVAGE